MSLNLFYIFTALFFLFENPQRFTVVIPTAEQEAEYVWRTIRDIKFFEQYGYQISLPPGELIETLKYKGREGSLSDSDYSDLLAFLQKEVFKSDNYQAGYDRVKQVIPGLKDMINQIAKNNYQWDFKLFDEYEIMLTLYGSGGSYNPDDGSILLYTTVEGGFKQYDNPVNILIHEVTHLGVEESIINQFNVPHGLKERIVDSFVYLNFNEILPVYRIQQMGDVQIDGYLQNSDDLLNLNSIVEKFLSK